MAKECYLGESVRLRERGRKRERLFSSAAVAFPLEVLRAACIEPEGSAFETPNEDLLLTAAGTEWHL